LIKQLIEDSENNRFVEEFSAPSVWETHDATYEIENGEMTMTPTGTNYFALLVRNGLNFSLNKYPFIATRITALPPANVSWSLKMFDGGKDVFLNGSAENQVANHPDIYVWNLKTLSGWSGNKNSNLQIVLESASPEYMQGFQVKYDWIRAYESLELLNVDLGTGINPIYESGYKYAIHQNILEITEAPAPVQSLSLYTVSGEKMATSQAQKTINTGTLPKGVYILIINNQYVIKVFI
jgi:hypothetical protein